MYILIIVYVFGSGALATTMPPRLMGQFATADACVAAFLQIRDIEPADVTLHGTCTYVNRVRV